MGIWAFMIALVGLIANGRPIGSGDTSAMERTAESLAAHGTVRLPENAAPDPFTRPVPGGRVSIYPALPALLAAPLFFVFGQLFDPSVSGSQVAGKLSAALLAAAAVSILARAWAKRVSAPLALGSALLFGLGTSVYSTSQALWQHPAVILFMVVAIASLARMEAAAPPDQAGPATWAALGLSLAAASRPAAIPMCAVLFVFLLLRARSHALRLLTVASIPAAFVATYNLALFGAPWRFGQDLAGRFFSAFPESVAGLLISPARGLLIFTPVALLAGYGLLGAARRTPLARGLLVAALVHFAFVATWNEWHGGESFGPRLLTDALPALFFYLPEGLAAWPAAGGVLGLLSVSIQFLGGWTYDYRWERLHQRGRGFDQALWSWTDSPLAFAIREGVMIQGIPEVVAGRVRARPHRFLPLGTAGSTVEATPHGLRIGGEPLIRDVRLERGARIEAGWMSLIHPADALAFRSISAGPRSVHLVGSLEGVLSVATRNEETPTSLAGDFDLTVPLRLEAGEEVYVRARSGELRLARLAVSAVEADP